MVQAVGLNILVQILKVQVFYYFHMEVYYNRVLAVSLNISAQLLKVQIVLFCYFQDGSGSIDFREYVIGLSLVSTPANTDSTISLAFQVLSSQFGEHLQVESFLCT